MFGFDGPFLDDSPDPLEITPDDYTLPPSDTVTFVASGGTAPYVYSISVNNSGGTIDPDTGEYTAGTTGSVDDTILVTDADDNTATATAHVTAGVTITPSAPTVFIGADRQFTASGGTDTGFTWSITVNNSGGSINPTTGLYTAGTTPDVTDTIQVVDSLGNIDTATATTSNLIAVWDVILSPDTQGNLRFTMVNGALFDLLLVHEGDLAYIYGDEFEVCGCNGTYEIKAVSVTYEPGLVQWFEIENPLGNAAESIEQIVFQDLMFFRPKRRTIYDNPRHVVVCEK